MESLSTIVRLGLGGLLLDQRAFQAQRDTPGGIGRGALLVALVALLVAVAALIGDLGEYLTQPDPTLASETLASGLMAMPWYEELTASSPSLADSIGQLLAQPGSLSLTPSPLAGVISLVATPLLALLSWLISGAIIHIAARAFGGGAPFGQTLACTAVASGAGLLGLVQVVPYAEAIPGSLLIASSLLGLIGTYIAVREVHSLPPWRSFWAVTIGPVLLTALLVGLYCCVVFVFAGALAGLGGGAGR
ncbi:MAG: YIP1 family protein [Chloroflexales bacterium]|nr:YIP1 family protein [Chloroflexales bacterium]